MSVIKQTDQAPETIDTTPRCECIGPECDHPLFDAPAEGRYRIRTEEGWESVTGNDVLWLCVSCGSWEAWERIS